MRGLQKIDRVEIDSPRRAAAGDSEEARLLPSLTGGDENAAKSLFIQALRLTMSIIRDQEERSRPAQNVSLPSASSE